MTSQRFTGNTIPLSKLPDGKGHAAVVLLIDSAGRLLDVSGTREHNVAALSRQAVGSASARVALPALGASREIYVMSSSRCFFQTGDGTVVAAAGTSHPLAVDERFYLRVPAGHTHIAFIRDTADGFITICPVA